MMLSVLVWLAMWGQWQTPQLDDPGIVRPLVPHNAVNNIEFHSGLRRSHPASEGRSAEPGPRVGPPSAKPAEHVIEIKTVREDHGTAKDKRTLGLGGSPYCDKPDDSLEYTDQCKENICTSMYIAPHCVKLTRELWIDGVKFGVIKGLD